MTQISSKLAALAVALMMNGLIISGVAFLFNSQLQQHTSVPALAQGVPAAANSVG